MRMMTARKMWNAARIRGNLPHEWNTWEKFRAWVNDNQYKASYGYQGEFTPENLLKATRGSDKTTATTGGEFHSLMRMRLDELKRLAIEKGFEINEAATKKEIATLICGGERVGQNRQT